MKFKIIIGKILYGVLFIIAIPILLILWAKYTASSITLPVPSNQVLNYVALLIGLFFLVVGMVNLWFFGKGLPMNAFPPKNYVKNGVYAITKNPIYFGTIIMCFSLSAILQSPSGFWLVSPFFTLMTIAYTIGFENEQTTKIFGKQNYIPILSLPNKTEQELTIKDRGVAYIIAYLPWLLMYETFIFIGVPNDAIYSNLPFENQFYILEFTAFFYVLTYLYAFLVPLILNSKKTLREFEIDIWVATIISAICYFTIPFAVNQQDFIPETFLGNLLLFDRSLDAESASFPAFHVIWALIASRYFAIRFNKLKWLWYSIGILISLSCITTGNHSLLDILAGVIVYIITTYRMQIWNFIRLQSERIANSWKEWRFGSIRIINHGFYACATGFFGTLLMNAFVESKYYVAVFIVGICGIVGAALWAQFVEGSPKLQRPYGYYGSIVGVAFGGILIIMLFPINFYILVAAICMAGPWIQIIGRLRCLVQGCCHGKPASEWLGIHFTSPFSRVNKISGLRGASLHPTQLYSIGTNLLIGLILIRLYNLNMSATFIIGIYLLLNSLGRFVEEFYRGESQTPYWAGMRIYQWIAIFNVVLGAFFTCLPFKNTLSFQLNFESLYWAIGMGLFAMIAYGVDFPNSNRRFARLTSS